MADNNKAGETEFVPREQKATPIEPAEATEVPAVMGATFAERAKASAKQVAADEQAEDKAVASKSTRKKAAKKS